MENETKNEEEQEIKVFYDKRENQKIPLLAVSQNRQQKIWHHLKPLSDERYFTFADELEKIQNDAPGEIKKLYQPQYNLWRELFIEREGAKEKDPDNLFTEGVQAINALIYCQKFEVSAVDPDKEFYFDDEAEINIHFGAMFSGVFLGLHIEYKSDFDSLIDEYLSANRRKRKLGLSFNPSHKERQIYEFALPFVTKSKGYAEGENLIDVVPAWHITQTTDTVFSSQLRLLTGSPVVLRTFEQ